MTQMSYTAVPQLGQLLAHSSAALLPGGPKVHTDLSYMRIQPTAPTQRGSVPRTGGGTLEVGPGKAARLFLFFATWDQETSGLAGDLDSLNRYQAVAARTGLPRLTGVDEASVEPSLKTPTEFLDRLPHPLSYPVALDESGKLADGYEVLGLPWFVLTSPTGKLLYYREVTTAGWPSTSVLVRYVKAALARVPTSASGATVSQRLAGSPPPLASLHQQADQLLGNQSALAARIRALRGYPIVINAWASWCGPCRSEFRPVRVRVGALRAAGRVPRRRHRRLRRGRSHLPRGASRQLPELRDHHPRPLVAGRDPRPAHDDLHQPSGKGRVRAHRPIRLAGHTGLGHRQLCAFGMTADARSKARQRVG
jgi:thiol-disulfide isomerase/thioredoxin